MSDVSGSTKVLFILKNPEGFQSQESFLRRRGWEVTLVATLREAIEHIVSRKPDFVLISVNHPNPKVAKMPAIIAQTFNCKSILIGESLDGKTAAALTNSGWRDVIHAPVSGPGIQLRIKQIFAREKQEMELAENPAPIASPKGLAPSAMGPGSAASQAAKAQQGTQKQGPMFFSSEKGSQSIKAPSIAEQIANRSNSSGTTGPNGYSGKNNPRYPGASSSVNQNQKSNFHPQPGGASQAQAAGFQPPIEPDAGNPFMGMPEVTEGESEADFDFTASECDISSLERPLSEQEQAALYPAEASESSSEPESESSTAQQPVYYSPEKGGNAPFHYNPQTGKSSDISQGKGDSINRKSSPPGRDEGAASSPDSEGSTGQAQYHETDRSKEPQIQNKEGNSNSAAAPKDKDSDRERDLNPPVNQVKPNQMNAGSEPASDTDSEDGQTEFAAKTSLKNLGASGDQISILRVIKESFEECTDLSEAFDTKEGPLFYDGYYINVEGSAGFLMYSSNSKNLLESHLVPKINTRIIESLKQQGFALDELTNLDTSYFAKVDVSVPSIHKSSILSLVTDSGADQLMLSYLEASSAFADISEDKDKKMIGFPVECIPPEISSPFKVYLYLPVNQKYYLYLNESNSFSNKQIDNLEKKGVKNLYIKVEDKDKLDDFFMSKRLFDKLGRKKAS